MEREEAEAAEWRPWERGVSARPFLPLSVVEAVFRFDEVAALPAHRGALWRSVLGPQLKAIDAQGGWRPTSPTPLPPSLFDWFYRPTAAIAMLPPDIGAALSPLVVDAPPQDGPQMVRAGAPIACRIVLAGRAGHAAQALVMALASAARDGLGEAVALDGRRGRATLTRASADGVAVRDEASGWLRAPPEPRRVPPPPCPPAIRVFLRTPFRLERDGRDLRPDDFVPADLIMALVRRVSSLMRTEAGVVLDADFAALARLARTAPWRPERLARQDLSRWSSRQHRRFPSSGLVGSFLLDMQGREDLFDFLWLGLFLHAGKGTMAGSGGLAIEAL